ncbi:MAG: ketopantoate reductase family protein [Deltaproteobacteria bacterium]|jgi:2-dehydropantoate 2-reductase|nr:ketopantoate reductase family protein [Deltaproteobacteria bacterium]
MRIALLGAGSIGTILGALISRGGENIVLVDSYKNQVESLNQNGAKIIGFMDCIIPVKAILPNEMSGKYDLIISTTKQTTLTESLTNALPFMHDQTIVLTLQNGIPEDISKRIVGEERVMGGGVEFGASWVKPGVSELTSDKSSLVISFGRLDGKINKKTKAIQQTFLKFGRSHVTDNILGVRYSKLTDNSTFSAMSAVLACNNGKILDSYKAMTCIAHLGREAGLIIEKMGIKVEKIFGLQPDIENVGFNTKKEMDRVIYNYWTPIYTPFRAGIASMLQDIQAGRKSEINQINGKFVELGKQMDIKVPFMETVTAVVTKLQNGELKLENAWENLNFFDIPEVK